MIHLRTILLSFAVTSFATAQAPFRFLESPLPPNVIPEAIGDLDGDGDADLLTQTGVQLNDGNARFTATAVPSLVFYRQRTILADLDGNGFQDVISRAGIVRIDMNGGALAFTGPVPGLPSTALPVVPTYVGDMAAADVDLDGDVDLMLSRYLLGATGVTTAPPALWLNNGSAIFTAAVTTPQAMPSGFIVLRDLDGNGYPDAVFTDPSPGSVQCALNNAGTFTPSYAHQWFFSFPLIDFQLGDFNGDGRPDIAVATPAISINFNSAAGYTGFVSNGVPGVAFRPVDVNGDGIDEMVVQLGGAGLWLRFVAPGGAIGFPVQSWPTCSLTSGIDATDLDGDGDRDLVVRNSGTSSTLLMNDGAGGLVRVGSQNNDLPIYAFAAGNVNTDGVPDLIYRRGAGLATSINDGDGNFSPGPMTAIAAPGVNSLYYTQYAFDRDGDGDSDLYAASNVYTAVSGASSDFIYDDVGGTFTQIATVAGAGYTAAFQAADLDGDGDQDILLGRRNVNVSNGVAGPMLFLRNNGAAGLAAPVAIGTNHSTYDLDLGDFDGNGTIDVFQTNASPSLAGGDPSVVYLNAGNATFTPIVQTFGGYFAAAGDLNADGLSDMIIDGQTYFSAGSGTFTLGPALTSPALGSITLVDVDLDGDLDLVESPATIMLNSGGGVFGPPISVLPRAGPTPTASSSAVVDLDQDGDPDIVAPDGFFLTNVTRQLAHGSWPRPGRPASIDLYGTPGSLYLLYVSSGPASFPFPPYGTALIDPSNAVLGVTGIFSNVASPNPGTATLSGILPNNPAIAGWTTYWQAIDAATLHVTNRIKCTVLNY